MTELQLSLDGGETWFIASSPFWLLSHTYDLRQTARIEAPCGATVRLVQDGAELFCGSLRVVEAVGE